MVIAAVAFVTVHMANGFSVGQGGYEFIMLIFAAAFALFVSGAGKYSLDCLLRKN
jgi:putative oxidoreductase